jgi:hypothetical protein
MALRKIINVEGKVVVQTTMGNIEEGTRSVSLPTYIKVVSVNGTKNEVSAIVSFTSEDKNLFQQYQVPVSVEAGAPNFIAQVYEHLKTLPEFSGAENC